MKNQSIVKRICQLVAIGVLSAVVAEAEPEFNRPGWLRSSLKTPASPLALDQSQAGAPNDAGGGFSMFSLVSYPEIAEAATPEIQALARGLENDPKKIFDYVHDHIRYVHYFGSKKGAQLTLLERSGNDFDQCALLVAMLRAAGLTASYRFGIVGMPYENYDDRDFQHWLGLSKPATNLTEALNYAVDLTYFRGFPLAQTDNPGVDQLYFHRVWVKLVWNSTTYWLDPAFKVNYPIAGIDLTNAMRLSTNQLMTTAGGTSNADSIVSMSETNLRNQLRDYTTNTIFYLKTNSPNASVEEIVGGQSISTSAYDPLSQSLAFVDLNVYSVNWDYIPTNLMTSLQIVVDGTNQSLFMPQLQGQKLALTFTTNGLGQLWLDDQLLVQKQTSGGSTVNVAINVDHPHGYWLTNNTIVNTNWNDQATTNTYQRTNASYAITYAFEPDQEWLQKRQNIMDQYRQQGLADNSREVLTETLNIMGLSWMLQTERIPRVLAAQQNILLQHHHRFGRMAQEFGKGYYIDVYEQLSGIFPASGDAASDMSRSDRVFDLDSYFASAAEHGLIEQLQSSNLVAASTVKLLQLANANGQKIFLAKNGNWTTGSNIKSQLTGYDATTLSSFDTKIAAGHLLLLPQKGTNLVAGAGSWKGYGVVDRLVNASGEDMAMLISGNYNGGYSGFPSSIPDPIYVTQTDYSQPFYFDPVPALVPAPSTFEPVSMADGSYWLTASDLSLGGAEPRGMTFTRNYRSSRRNHNLAGMAYGWVHNYYLKATDVSAPLAVLGDTTPAQMAPLIVATKAAFELYNTNAIAKVWAVTALIAKWGIDQSITNAVTITLGENAIQFTKQPDGTFTPPAKSTMTLLRTNGVYWLSERHGNTFKFNGTGLLTNIVDQYSQGLKLTYGTGATSNWVTQVTDWKSRTLTMTYSGTPVRMASVADSTGRTVSYGYTTNAGQLDLTSVTDAEGKTNTWQYDTNHQIILAKDGLGRPVVSNLYDGFSRVIEQYGKGDTNQTWQLFWSDYVNVEKDPAGGRKQYFFDDKHRMTTMIDAMNHYSDTYYDGQDHTVLTVSHLYAVTDYIYDGRHNLIQTIDPLGYTNSFFYDAQDNLVRTVDARGNTNLFGYNAKFQMTGQTNAAGDWLTFAFSGTDGTLTNRTDVGGTTAYAYDANGYLSQVIYPGGLGGEGFVNQARGDVLSRTNANGFVTSFQYNNRREVTNTIAPTNITAKVTFDAADNIASITDARGFTRSNVWSATQKLLATILPATPQGIPSTTNVYDNRDWLKQAVDPFQRITLFTNDAAQRPISVTDPLLRTVSFGFDGDNRKIATTNAVYEVTRQAWNSRSELIQVTDPTNHTIRKVYDATGSQVALTNRNGKTWQFQFDLANRLTNTISPLNRQIQLTYDSRGLLKTLREPSGQMTTNIYDPKGRLTNRVDALSPTTFRYDANNNVTNIVEAGKTNAWTFDAYNRVSSYKDADGNLLQYRYDVGGNLTNLIYPGGKSVSYGYDSLNRMTNVMDWANRITSIEYDLASRVTRISRPNGTVREINYDAVGEATNIVEKTTMGTAIAFFKYNWNNAARMQWEFIAPVPHTFTPPTRSMSYDDDNRISLFNGQSLVYDLDGNMTTGPLTNDTLVSYTYDPRNRLLSAGGVNYEYDPAGNRVGVTNGANAVRYVVNPNAALPQTLVRTKADGSKTFYVYGAGLLYEVNETSGGAEISTHTYHYDYRGSTIALSDGIGIVTDRIEYSSYASTAYRTGTTDTPFLFDGRYGVMTDVNGLLFMRARYYNPYICRFINPDPSGFSGGLNFYSYADGNPISFIDPYGLGASGGSDNSSWLRTDLISSEPCIVCHGVSAEGFNGDVNSFSSYLPNSGGIGPNARDGYSALAHWSAMGYDSPQGTSINMAVGVASVLIPELILEGVAVSGSGMEVGAMGKGIFYNGRIVEQAPIEAITSHEVLAGSLVKTAPSAGTQGTLVQGAEAFTYFVTRDGIKVIGSPNFGPVSDAGRAAIIRLLQGGQ